LHGLDEEQLRFCLPGSSCAVWGDLDEVRAAVSNLIDNAVKYSRNYVRVQVEVLESHGKYLALRVKDQGIGIPRSELKRIFKRFYRVSGSATARVNGTGLGLYIVRSVATRHGGRAWAESEGPGQGSIFVLELPVAL
jgi:two-component system, OmpR family, sensor histidine kinase SenX3